MGMPPYHRQTHGSAQGTGLDSADFASGFRVCSATQPLTSRRASPVPWGQGQCGPPLNSPCGKEAPNTEHVKPVGHPATSTPRHLHTPPPLPAIQLINLPFFRHTARGSPSLLLTFT